MANKKIKICDCCGGEIDLKNYIFFNTGNFLFSYFFCSEICLKNWACKVAEYHFAEYHFLPVVNLD